MIKHLGIVAVALSLVCPPAASADRIEFLLTGNGGLGLLPTNVTPPTSSTGFGGIGATRIYLETDDNNLHIDIAWGSGNGYGDLSGEVTMLHLHGPTDDLPPNAWSQRGPLIENLGGLSLNFNNSPTNGSLVDDYFISNADIPALLAGRTYINVHTEMYESGEIRGYLIQANQIPEPATVAGPVFCAVMLLQTRRRRVNKTRITG